MKFLYKDVDKYDTWPFSIHSKAVSNFNVFVFFWQIAHHNDDKIRDEVWTLKRRNMDPFDSDSGNDDDLLVWSTVVFGIGYGCLSD